MYPPVLAGDAVLVAQMPGLVAAYALTDGKERWRTDLRPEAPLVVDDERVIVSSGDAIHALRVSDGALLWRAPSGPVTIRPVVKDGWVVVASGTTVRTLRATDGSSVWVRDVPYVRHAPAITGNTLIVGTADGFVAAHDLRTGEPAWRTQLGGAPAEPLVARDRIYVGASDRNFYCLDALTGRLEWPFFRIGASMPMRAAADDRRVYVVALDNMVRAFDLNDGELKWQKGVPFRPYDGPVLASGVLLVGGPVPDVRRLQPADGSPLASLTFPDKLMAAPAIAEGPDGLRVAALTGNLKEAWMLSLIVAPGAAPGPGR